VPPQDNGFHCPDEVCVQCVSEGKPVTYISMGTIQHPIKSDWSDIWNQLTKNDSSY
jgi:hypothetical protein